MLKISPSNVSKILKAFFLNVLFTVRIKNNSNKIWLFSNYIGYKDNARFLFEYAVKQKNTHLQVFWIANNIETAKLLSMKGLPYIRPWSLRYLRYSFFCDIIFITNLYRDVPMLSLWRTKVISLWHGIQIKRVLLDHDGDWEISNNHYLNNISHAIYKRYLDRMDFLISSSKKNSELFTSCFGKPAEKVLETGYPRTDVVLSRLHSYKNGAHKKKIVLFAPTWRIADDESVVPTHQFVQRMKNYALENGAKMFICCHPYTSDKVIDKIRKICDDNILLIQNKRFDITKYLHFVDLLITDYSSVFFDFLLTGRPTIFLTPDFNNFERKFYDDFNSIYMNQNVTNWNDCFEKILEIDRKGVQNYFSEYHSAVLNKYFDVQDAHNCKRIYDQFIGLNMIQSN